MVTANSYGILWLLSKLLMLRYFRRYPYDCKTKPLHWRLILVVTKPLTLRYYMRYLFACISKALHRGIILVATANSYGLQWL